MAAVAVLLLAAVAGLLFAAVSRYTMLKLPDLSEVPNVHSDGRVDRAVASKSARIRSRLCTVVQFGMLLLTLSHRPTTMLTTTMTTTMLTTTMTTMLTTTMTTMLT